ncbi:hypothetical protein JOF56_007458 [Kibdelosporangium banguiense]|uniref:Uncharacterized protein n=1 Tax=Kibdelosporangium banguiense TaxID=1365924 RepID=A0ABS4TRN9_9PSEU|nr:hypothetical protein [Kibdelosporangium banguiense]MBP2327073.1 hypothetical protein [Kibdelosporangium banguiense]
MAGVDARAWFAEHLGDLRRRAGSPSYRDLARHMANDTSPTSPKALADVVNIKFKPLAHTTLNDLVIGKHLTAPDAWTVSMFVLACVSWSAEHGAPIAPDMSADSLRQVLEVWQTRRTEYEALLQHTSRARGKGVWFTDGELGTHWNPRARGVERGSQAGWYFTGRTQVLRELVAWLTGDAPDGRVRVVTGGPGSGKSAVLARLATLADPGIRANTPLNDVPDDTVPTVGCVDLAILAHGRSAPDVLERIARAVAVDLTAVSANRQLDVLVDHILAGPVPLTVVVDALDEAAEPHAIGQALRDIARDAASAGVRVLVGTRPGLRDGLLTACGHQAQVIDLDREPWLQRDDLAGYVRQRLLATDDPRTSSPYRDRPDLAAKVADAVADRAFPTFLFAQLISRALILGDAVADPAARLPGTVADALEDYLLRFGKDSTRARDLLVPLAYAHGTGLARDDAWVELAGALGQRTYTLADLDWLLTTAADFLVEQTVDDDAVHHRLYHQALVDFLRPPAAEDLAQRRITRTLVSLVPAAADSRPDWTAAPSYVRRHLARHAAAADLLQPLLDDAGFVLTAEDEGLRTAINQRPRGLYHHLLLFSAKDWPRRAASLEQRARLVGLDRLAEDVARVAPDRPWATPWTHIGGEGIDEPHGCPPYNVFDATVVETGDGPVLIHSGFHHLVVRRLSDSRRLATLGAPEPYRGDEENFGDDWFAHLGWVYSPDSEAPHPFHQGAPIYSVASGRVNGETYVVVGADDGAVRLWHLGPAASCAVHEGTRAAAVDAWRTRSRLDDAGWGGAWVKGVAIVDGDRPMVVAADLGGSVHFLDLASGTPVHPAGKHPGNWLWTAAAGEVAGKPIFLTAGSVGDTTNKGAVQMWDPAAGVPVGDPMLHNDVVRSVAVTTLQGRPVAVTRTNLGEISIWDLSTRRLVRQQRTRLMTTWPGAAVTEIAGRQVLVFGSAIEGFTVELVDLASLEHLDSVGIGSEVLSVVGSGPLVVVGCMRGVLALRLHEAVVRSPATFVAM